MRHRLPPAVFVVAGLLFASGCASADKAQPDRLYIGAWNIEWLDQPERRSGPAKGVTREAADLADYIEWSGVSMLSLQEITRNADDGSARSDTLIETFAMVSERTGGQWEHVVFPSSRNQNVGVAWDMTRLTLLSEPDGWEIPVDRSEGSQGRNLWSRPPRAMHFSTGDGKTDFVVIPIHMKSNYGGDFSQHRAEEARALVDALPAVRERFGDSDIVIIGDTNSPSHSDDSIAAYEAAGFVDLNDEDAITYWRGTALDRILVPADQPEFESRFFLVGFDLYADRVGTDLRGFKVRWSDHFMVISWIEIQPDDD